MRLRYSREISGFDLVLSSGRIQPEDGLLTAYIDSLFTWRRATAAQLKAAGLPTDHNLGGFWGDSYPVQEDDPDGSLLWTLEHSTRTDETLALAQQYAEEATAWMVADKVVQSTGITTGWYRDTGFLIIGVAPVKPDEVQPRWRRLWNAITGEEVQA